MKLRLLLIIVAIACLTGCGDDNVSTTYSRYRAYFRYDKVMTAAKLHGALISPGTFCAIYTGGNYLYFQDHTKTEPNQDNLTSVAYYQSYITIAGFIVGLSNLPDMNTGGIQYMAYDRVCSNCYEDNSISKPLTLLENGIAKCERCKRLYDLNNQGIIRQGDKGRTLFRYRSVTYNGNNTVEIRNP
jgi:hypothetical protein